MKPGDTLHVKSDQLPSQAFWWQKLNHTLSHQRLVVEFNFDSRLRAVMVIQVEVEGQTVIGGIDVGTRSYS